MVFLHFSVLLPQHHRFLLECLSPVLQGSQKPLFPDTPSPQMLSQMGQCEVFPEKRRAWSEVHASQSLAGHLLRCSDSQAGWWQPLETLWCYCYKLRHKLPVLGDSVTGAILLLLLLHSPSVACPSDAGSSSEVRILKPFSFTASGYFPDWVLIEMLKYDREDVKWLWRENWVSPVSC